MRINAFVCIFFINIIIISCASSKVSLKRKGEIEQKINIAIEHAKMRSELNIKQYLEILWNENKVNDYSEELIINLQKNGYIEADINKLYDLEIERILLLELFNKKMGLLDTYNETYIIENVKYEVTYLCDSKDDIPNFYTEVYVYDSERKNIRAFYKINYYSEYKIVNDGMKYYKVFY